MSKIGYVFAEVSSKTMELMAECGLDQGLKDKPCNERTRPKWKEALSLLKKGDALVIPRLSNVVRSLGELARLIDLCRLREIRIISIEDEIDTDDEMFGVCPAGKVLDIIARLPQEVINVRQALGEDRLQYNSGATSDKKVARMMRDRRVISMYIAGHSIEMIMRKAGIKHSSLYNILKRNGICRGRIVRK